MVVVCDLSPLISDFLKLGDKKSFSPPVIWLPRSSVPALLVKTNRVSAADIIMHIFP